MVFVIPWGAAIFLDKDNPEKEILYRSKDYLPGSGRRLELAGDGPTKCSFPKKRCIAGRREKVYCITAQQIPLCL